MKNAYLKAVNPVLEIGMPALKTDAVPRQNSLMLVARLDAAGKVELNNEPPMEISALKTFLSNLIKERERNGLVLEGTNVVEKTITLVTEPDVKYGDVIKFIDELDEIGARPVEFGELSKAYQPFLIKSEPRKVENSGSQGEGVGKGNRTVSKP